MLGPLLAKFAPHLVGVGVLAGAWWWHTSTVDDLTERAEAAEIALERSEARRTVDREVYAQAQAKAAEQRAIEAQRIVDERVAQERRRLAQERQARLQAEQDAQDARTNLDRARAALVAADGPCLLPADLGRVLNATLGPDDPTAGSRPAGRVPGTATAGSPAR